MKNMLLVLWMAGCGASHVDDPDAGGDAGTEPAVEWRVAAAPQTCLGGSSGTLERSTLVLPWTELGMLAMQCEGEATQLYDPDRDRWERDAEVAVNPIEPFDAPPDPVDYPSIMASAILPDGTRVAVAGSVHAAPPYQTWIAPPGASAWQLTSVDAPSVWFAGAGAVADDRVLFAGIDAYVLVVRRTD